MRIISGKYKGKILKSPKSENIRPTLDMVKQAFFTKFQFEILDCSFLDLFGGSGAIGIEAVSRGAKSVVICDNSEDSIKLIRQNASTLQEDIDIKLIDYKKFLKTNTTKFDFIYIDPPYGHVLAYNSALKIIKENTQLNPNGIVVCEHNQDIKFNYEGYSILDEKKYGTVILTYLKIMQ